MIEVDGPQRVNGYRQDITDQPEQFGLVVQHAPQQQPFTIGVDHHEVVIYTDVHPAQISATVTSVSSPSHISPADDRGDVVLQQRSNRVSQLAVESSQGSRRPSPLSLANGDPMTAIPKTPGAYRSYE
ncbi:hypothetical protein [Nocardia nepalensis]|uniref:hypothetical protein n=1 Tax=Nocardia nepalensis TaxID=3375448 RepID=UPI003B67AC01